MDLDNIISFNSHKNLWSRWHYLHFTGEESRCGGVKKPARGHSSQVEEPGFELGSDPFQGWQRGGGTAVVTITGKPPAHSTPCLPSVVTQFYYREKTATKIRENLKKRAPVSLKPKQILTYLPSRCYQVPFIVLIKFTTSYLNMLPRQMLVCGHNMCNYTNSHGRTGGWKSFCTK